jgi:hypothetical protein
MPTLYVKLFVGLVLFATWIALVVYKVPGADALIAFIQASLGALFGYHAADRSPKSAAQ